MLAERSQIKKSSVVGFHLHRTLGDANSVIESPHLAAWDGVWGGDTEEGLSQAGRGLLGVMEVVTVLTVVMVSWMGMEVRMYPIVCFST